MIEKSTSKVDEKKARANKTDDINVGMPLNNIIWKDDIAEEAFLIWQQRGGGLFEECFDSEIQLQ